MTTTTRGCFNTWTIAYTKNCEIIRPRTRCEGRGSLRKGRSRGSMRVKQSAEGSQDQAGRSLDENKNEGLRMIPCIPSNATIALEWVRFECRLVEALLEEARARRDCSRRERFSCDCYVALHEGLVGTFEEHLRGTSVRSSCTAGTKVLCFASIRVQRNSYCQ